MTAIVLASQSAQRKHLMETLGVEFLVHPAAIDEYAISGSTPIDRAEKIALAKAQAVAKVHPSAVIIAADSYVIQGKRTFEKPKDRAEAIQMLTDMQHQQLIEVTGVCMIAPDWPELRVTSVTTQFTFRTLSQAEIERYVDTNPVLTWSAAFSPAYHAGAALIGKVHGSLTSFTHGFPMELIAEWLKELTISTKN